MVEGRRAKSGKLQIRINPALCKGCEICVAFCPEHVLAMKDGKPVVVALEQCTECLQCEMRCPDFAIDVERYEPVAPPEPEED
jgi:2-oxoglutarate ferredoxin oxidoreductase subunit delta